MAEVFSKIGIYIYGKRIQGLLKVVRLSWSMVRQKAGLGTGPNCVWIRTAGLGTNPDLCLGSDMVRQISYTGLLAG